MTGSPYFADLTYTRLQEVLKFTLSFLAQIRDILSYVSKILPCFGSEGR